MHDLGFRGGIRIQLVYINLPPSRLHAASDTFTSLQQPPPALYGFTASFPLFPKCDYVEESRYCRSIHVIMWRSLHTVDQYMWLDRKGGEAQGDLLECWHKRERKKKVWFVIIAFMTNMTTIEVLNETHLSPFLLLCKTWSVTWLLCPYLSMNMLELSGKPGEVDSGEDLVPVLTQIHQHARLTAESFQEPASVW